MIKAVIFDCFGVLIGDVLRVKAADLSATQPEVAEQIYAALRSGDRGIISRQKVAELIGEALGVSAEEVQAMSDKGEVPNEALIAEIPRLRATYQLGLLSNVASRAWLEDRFGTGRLDELFDAVVASGEVGVIKPEPEIYHITATRLGALPEECVFIDDIERNVEGARAVGMQGIVHINNAQTLQELTAILQDAPQ